MGTISKIEPQVVRLLQSQVTLTDVTDVVRELIENSIDAGASLVTVKVWMQDYFQVSCDDNGCGIIPEDLPNVAKRHYTSKLAEITGLDQLQDVKTLGFRGELLHSVASLCSILKIETRPRGDECCYGLSIDNKGQHHGVVRVEESTVPSSGGTCIVACNVFGPLTVRLRNLLRVPTSRRIHHLRQILFAISVAHPNVRIRLFTVNSECEKLVTSTGNSLHTTEPAQILRSVFGISFDEHESLQADYENYHLKALVGLKSAHDKSYQLILINNRRVCNAELLQEVNLLFNKWHYLDLNEVLVPNFTPRDSSPSKGKSPTKKLSRRSANSNPIFVFQVTCPSIASDLVQSPSKQVYDSQHIGIVRVLIMRLLKVFFSKRRQPKSAGKEVRKLRLESNLGSNSESNSPENGRRRSGNVAADEIDRLITKLNPLDRKSAHFEGISKTQFSLESLSLASVVGQVDRKFILVRIDNERGKLCLLAIDQHACDERIQVEKLLKQYILELCGENRVSCSLKEAVAIEMSEAEINILKEYQDALKFWGLDWYYAPQGLQITHLPTILGEKTQQDGLFLKQMMMQHCYDMANNHKSIPNVQEVALMEDRWWSLVNHIPRLLVDMFNSKACRSAVMFGDDLSSKQCSEYVRQLLECKLPFICAHGRPSIVPLIDLGSG